MATDAQKQTLRRNAVAKMASHLGERENPSNRCPLADAANAFVGNPLGSAYCVAAAIYCLVMAATQMGLSQSDTTVEKTGYCPEAYTHAKANGTAIDPRDVAAGRATVQPGDIVLVFEAGQDGGRLPHHGEMIDRPPSLNNPTFTTIGANTLPDGWQGDESRGIGVFAKRRRALDTNPDGHPRYVFVRTV